jgi:hypothetical protein
MLGMPSPPTSDRVWLTPARIAHAVFIAAVTLILLLAT